MFRCRDRPASFTTYTATLRALWHVARTASINDATAAANYLETGSLIYAIQWLRDYHLGAIDRQRFLYLVHETPYFALQVMQTLVERLRRERDLQQAI
ncbi:MAG: hypothetical protein HC822_26600 [Oscillochloris sp.]|nr:hypothetical protein [Oscillochloris sp.]